MFKVGDVITMNPRYRIDRTRGFITSQKSSHNPDKNIIDWEDGRKGEFNLNSQNDFLILV